MEANEEDEDEKEEQEEVAEEGKYKKIKKKKEMKGGRKNKEPRKGVLLSLKENFLSTREIDESRRDLAGAPSTSAF